MHSISNYFTLVLLSFSLKHTTKIYSRKASLPFCQNIIILLGDKCVNNFARVVTWQWNEPESSRRPIDHAFDVVTIRSPAPRQTGMSNSEW